MAKKRFDIDVPDGQHLGFSRETDGAYRGHLFDDETNELVGHAELHEVDDWDLDSDDDGHSNREPDSAELGLLGIAVLLGVTVAAVKGAQYIQNRRDRDSSAQRGRKAPARSRAEAMSSQSLHSGASTAASSGWYTVAYDPTTMRYWNGHEWTDHFCSLTDVGPTPALAGSSSADCAHQVTTTSEEATVTMTRQEWEQRVRAMLLARAFSEDQRRLLSHAKIEDADSALLELQRALNELTPQQFADRINLMLEANPALLNEAETEFLKLFGDVRRREAHPLQARPTRVAAETALGGAGLLTPAGWYDDGSGRQRWWNGQQWTEQLEPVQVLAPGHPGTHFRAGWYDDGAGRMRWWD